MGLLNQCRSMFQAQRRCCLVRPCFLLTILNSLVISVYNNLIWLLFNMVIIFLIIRSYKQCVYSVNQRLLCWSFLSKPYWGIYCIYIRMSLVLDCWHICSNAHQPQQQQPPQVSLPFIISGFYIYLLVWIKCMNYICFPSSGATLLGLTKTETIQVRGKFEH